MGNKNDSAISRREFARRAAFVSAAASLAPSRLLGPESIATPLPALQSAKVELYRVFRASGMRKADLARRIGIPKSNLDRLFELKHQSQFGLIEAAFSALNKHIWVEVRGAA